MKRAATKTILYSTTCALALSTIFGTASATIVIAPGQTLTIEASTGEDIINNGNLDIGKSGSEQTDITLSGVISGSGSVITYSNRVTLTGENTYTGKTWVMGELRVGNGGTTGSLAGPIFLHGSMYYIRPYVTFNRSDTYTYSGEITGPWIMGPMWNVFVTGSGKMIMGINTLGPVYIEPGATAEFNDSVSDRLVTIHNDGTLVYNHSGTWYNNYYIDGSGGVLIAGGTNVFVALQNAEWPWPMSLAKEKLYTGDTIIEHGTLQVGISSHDSRGVAYKGVPDHSHFILNDAADASLVIETTDKTTILSLDGGGPAGGNTILYPGSFLSLLEGGNYAGVISGGGLVEIQGGTLLLTGANTYTGATSISSGATLQLGNGGNSGSIVGTIGNAGTVSVNRAGHLALNDVIWGPGILEKRGSGTLVLNGVNTYTGLTTVSAGTLEVGDAVHPTARVAGDVKVAAGAVLSGHGRVLGAVSGDGAVVPGGSVGVLTVGSYTQNSASTLAIGVEPDGNTVLNVTGTATLAGKLAITIAPGTPQWLSEPILTAGTIVGQFSSITVLNSATAIYAVDTLSNAVVLTVEDRKAGQVYSDVVAAALDGGHALNGLILDHRSACQSGQNLCVWGSGFGGMGWFDTNSAAADAFKFKRAGAIAGFDAAFAGGQTIGVALSFNQTSVTVSHGWGGALINAVSGAVTGSAPLWLGELKANLFGTTNTATSHRDLGADGIAAGNPSGYTYGGAVEYGISLLGGSVVPLAGVSVVEVHQKAMVETGVGSLGYSQQSADFTSVRGELGVRLQRAFMTAGGVRLVPHLRAGVQQELNEVAQGVSLELVGHPESRYYPSYAGPAITAFAATATLDISSGQNWEVRLSTGTRLSARERQVEIGVGGSYRF